MAAPLITPASVTVLNGGGTTTGTLFVPLSAPGNDRVLAIVGFVKDNSTTAADVSTITVDSAGVNRTIGSGVTLQGSRQLAQESSFSSQCVVYFCLEPDLPTSAATYNVDISMDSATQYNMWLCFEVTGCPKQAYDAIIQNLSTVDVSAGTPFSDSITPVDDDCLIVSMWATSHSAQPTYTTSQTFLAQARNTNGAFIASQFTQVGSATAKTMTEESSTLHQRRAWNLISFSGVSSSNNIDVNTTTESLLTTNTTNTANINARSNLASGNKALSIITFAASISLSANIAVNENSLSIARQNVSINASQNVNSELVFLGLTSFNVNVKANNNVNSNLESLSVTAYNADVLIGQDINVNPESKSLILTKYNSSIKIDNALNTNSSFLSLLPLKATISVEANTNVDTFLSALNVTSYSANISVDNNVNVDTGLTLINLTQNKVGLKSDININSNLSLLTITPFSTSISIATTPTLSQRIYAVTKENRNYVIVKENRIKVI